MSATAEIIYLGELRTDAVHLKSGEKIVTDAPVDNNGKGQAFSPSDLLATSLGTCMLTIVCMVAERHEINLKGTKVIVSKVMAANPRRVSEIHVQFEIPGSFSEKDRILLENAAKTCPVAYSLHPDIKQEVHFQYIA